jgi:hypothetical protein
MVHQTTNSEVPIRRMGRRPIRSTKREPMEAITNEITFRKALYRSCVRSSFTPMVSRRTGKKYETAPLPDHWV